jgi:hypothetical protein
MILDAKQLSPQHGEKDQVTIIGNNWSYAGWKIKVVTGL